MFAMEGGRVWVLVWVRGGGFGGEGGGRMRE